LQKEFWFDPPALSLTSLIEIPLRAAAVEDELLVEGAVKSLLRPLAIIACFSSLGIDGADTGLCGVTTARKSCNELPLTDSVLASYALKHDTGHKLRS